MSTGRYVALSSSESIHRGLSVHNIDELKQCLLHVWHGVDQTIIDNAIDEWRERLRACVALKCWHFKQLLWQYSAIIIIIKQENNEWHIVKD